MINKYSYKISRIEANSKKLIDENIYKNNEKNFKTKILKDFLDIWKNMGKYNIQYKCNIMEEEYLHERMPLSNFLIDDGEIGKGMYLAAGYSNFIKWQNDFLEPITKSLDNNKKGILYYHNKNLKNMIDVQKATDNEIIKRDFPDNSNYIKDENNKNRKINYLNYNNFIYDFNLIEEELKNFIYWKKII